MLCVYSRNSLTFPQDYWIFLDHQITSTRDFILMNGWVNHILQTKYRLCFHLLVWMLARDRFLSSWHIRCRCLSKDSSQPFPTENSVRAKIFRAANSLARIPHERHEWPTDAADARDRTDCQSRVFFSLGGIQKLKHICNESFQRPHRSCIFSFLVKRKTAF